MLRSPSHSHSTGPEPQLLTHREPDYDEDLHDDPDLDDYEDEDRPLSSDDRKQRRRKIWRRVRRTAYVLTALGIIGPIVAFFVAYQLVEVPTPQSVAQKNGQVVRLTFADGQQMSEIVPPTGNRTFVRYDELPNVVKHAVFAAEDATFMENSGFDITGVMRAAWNQVNGDAGGGSTITQQYVKQATGDDDVSLTRKGTEIVKAYKMNNQYSKEQILEAYLNTIYFGRSAYGIVAAAKAYYGKELKDVTASEAALLAGMIQLPGRDKDEAYMRSRWNFVMNQMVDKGWLPAADRKAAGFPTLIAREYSRPRAIEGPGAHIQAAVLKEVQAETGMDLPQLQRGGYKIETTIDQNAQNLAQEAITKGQKDLADNVFPAMVVVDPTNGAVLAYFGGWNGNGLDWAATRQEPGSSFKPFDLVALLEKGKGLGEVYDGSSPRVFQGLKIRNAGGAQCPDCTVAEAMERSINTVFYDIALNTVTTRGVATAAKQAGIWSPLEGPNGAAPAAGIAIGGGDTRVSTYEMASAYATFAANGVHRKPHLVKQILNPDGSVFWRPGTDSTEGTPAFSDNSATSQKIARNVTESLVPVLSHSNLECADNRACAGKTGTHQFGETADNAKSWMVGYSPTVSVAVSLAAEVDGKQVPLKTAGGAAVTGAKGSGKIWQTFMNNFLKGKEKKTFGPYVPIGKKAGKKDNDDNDNDNNRSSNNQSSTTTTTTTERDDNGGPNSSTSEETDPEDTDDPESSGLIPPIGNGNGPGRNDDG